ncbi:MAG: gatC [Oscillospiraceae bacterium]|jgi:aspartyl-tRNA(Asn)/glutamyl-tRNA(Gln) amidotransferase subunit C|nr:gatC [Oscillospiraceae bacterium]
MKIDINHIAKLSRLKFSDDEAKKFENEMQSILDMVENLPPMEDIGALIDPENPMEMRKDEAVNLYKRDELLANAKQTQAGCVVVPKVVE